MRKQTILLAAVLVCALLLTGCQGILLHEFQDDPAGQIAERFFPNLQELPESAQSVFEYRTKGKSYYQGYYLKLVFDNDAAYESFLAQTEADYPDMTEEQRRHSYHHIASVHFSVDDYSFRAIDMSEYGILEDYIGLIAHCDPERTIVFMYFYHELGTIEDISDGLGQHGYMEFYGDSWQIGSKTE
jgi:hypothetical protein